MKVISDSQVVSFLLQALTKQTILHTYIPLLVSGLRVYEQHPDGVPERTVRSSTTEGSDTTHLFMPCVLPNTTGLKLISGGESNSRKKLGFQGSVSVLDSYTGELKAVVNAKNLTAFRTAMASCAGMVKALDPEASADVKVLSVFGGGPQAYWHAVLAARLYPTLEQINVVSRRLETAQELASSLEGATGVSAAAYTATDAAVEAQVQSSSIIFGCTPSTEAIIRKSYINAEGSRRKYISLIGSYKPHMIELDLDFINAHYGSGSDVKIVVDSKDHCLAEAGELIQGNIPESGLVSITELYGDRDHSIVNGAGVVLSKIVGLSVMDITMAQYVSEHIEGTVIEDF